MKYKFLTLSLLLAGACATTVMAQDTNYYTPKWSRPPMHRALTRSW